VLLLVLGGPVLRDAARITTGAAQPGVVGPRTVPVLVGAMLVVCAAFLAVDVLRGGRGEAEGGEDVDLARPGDWRTVALLVAAFLANVVLIEPVGWCSPVRCCSGAPPSRWAAAATSATRAVSFALSFGTYYLFAAGLGIGLPAGVLQGIL
jgi:putative tricarboxylic transport membrane protein